MWTQTWKTNKKGKDDGSVARRESRRPLYKELALVLMSLLKKMRKATVPKPKSAATEAALKEESK